MWADAGLFKGSKDEPGNLSLNYCTDFGLHCKHWFIPLVLSCTTPTDQSYALPWLFEEVGVTHSMQHGADVFPHSLSLPQQALLITSSKLATLSLFQKKDQLCQSISSVMHNWILKELSIYSETQTCKNSKLQRLSSSELCNLQFNQHCLWKQFCSSTVQQPTL